LGYYFVTGRTDIPYEIVLAFFIGFTALINFIDIKDYEGDKREGIKTIPTVLGLKRGKLVIGAIFLLCYIAFGVVLQNNLLLLFMALSGILQFYLINQKDYKESYVFSLYLIALAVVILSTILGLVTIPGLV
jgi:4-hydroxybenzoate polyprenyltransferase